MSDIASTEEHKTFRVLVICFTTFLILLVGGCNVKKYFFPDPPITPPFLIISKDVQYGNKTSVYKARDKHKNIFQFEDYSNLYSVGDTIYGKSIKLK